MFSVRSCSPPEMKILVPVSLYEPSGCLTALVRSKPKSVPHCGSVRFMVPAQTPSIIFGRNFRFSSSLPWVRIAATAPWTRPEYIEKARLAEARNSLTITVSVPGSPCPPYSVGQARPTQPPATSWPYASLNPLGVVTRPSSWRVHPSISPVRLRGVSTSEQSLPASTSIASTTSGVASPNPATLLWRSMWNTSPSRNITSSVGAL